MIDKKNVADLIQKSIGGNTDFIENYDQNLAEIGMTSISAISLVVQLEECYKISLDDDDLLLENFSTVNKIIMTISKYLPENI